MNKRKTARKAIAILLLFAMIVGVTVVLPVAVSAEDPAQITEFSYQTLAGATLDDASTDLRFLFKIDSLDYEKVGFVFSKSDDTPTIGEVGCGVYETTSVYGAVEAAGEPQAAGEGHWWVTVKLAGIPKASFGATVHVVGFVKAEGEDPVYSDVRSLSACAALGHDYEWTKNADTHAGTCSICGDEVATAGHNFSMAVSENVATYTCLDCGYVISGTVKKSFFTANPADSNYIDRFNINDSSKASKERFDSDGDDIDDCVRVSLNQSGTKIWINYVNTAPEYESSGSHVISYLSRFKLNSGASPDGNSELFWFYYSFSGASGSGTNDQGYGFRFCESNSKDVFLKAYAAESGTPTFGTMEYDRWYNIRTDATVTTADGNNTLQSINVYIDNILVHSVNISNLDASHKAAFATSNRVRLMVIGCSGATVSFEVKDLGIYVSSVN